MMQIGTLNYATYVINTVYIQTDALAHTIVNLKYLAVALQVEATLKQTKFKHNPSISSALFIVQLIMIASSVLVSAYLYHIKFLGSGDPSQSLSNLNDALVLLPAYFVCGILAVSLYKFWRIEKISSQR